MNSTNAERAGYAVIAGLLLVMFWNVLIMLEGKWSEAESYYSHGYIVPVISAALIWRMRGKLAKIPVKSSKAGLMVLIAGLMMRLMGAYRAVNFINGFSLIVILIGLVLFLFGRRLTLKLLFPLLFLSAMVPLPDVTIISISFELKNFAAELSKRVIPHLGILVQPDRNTFQFFRASVGRVRSMIALLAFGAIFAYIAKTNTRRRLEMFAASIPCSVIANMSRIVLITVVAYLWGAAVATEIEYIPNPFGGKGFTIHDATGIMIYLVAFLGFFSYDKLLNRPPFRLPRPRGKKRWLLDYDGMLVKLADNQLECLVNAGWLSAEHQVRLKDDAEWQAAGKLDVFANSPRKRMLKFDDREITFEECIGLAKSGRLRKDDFISYAGGSPMMRAGNLDFLRSHWQPDAAQKFAGFCLYAVLPVIVVIAAWHTPALKSLAHGIIGIILAAVVLWFAVRILLLLIGIAAHKLDVTEKPLPVPAMAGAAPDVSESGESKPGGK